MLYHHTVAPPRLRGTVVQAVDVALVLAVDSSGSISNEDLTLQYRGYAQALTSNVFMSAVQSGQFGQIALTFVAWSSVDRQYQIVPWRLIDSVVAAREFVASLLQAPVPTPGYTSLSGAIDFSRQLLAACGYPAGRQIIDVSGDGANNDGRPVIEARDEAIAAGITINGLPIIGSEPDIAAYYSRNVIGGPFAFVKVVRSLASFYTSVLEKFVIEIAAEPARLNVRTSHA